MCADGGGQRLREAIQNNVLGGTGSVIRDEGAVKNKAVYPGRLYAKRTLDISCVHAIMRHEGDYNGNQNRR